MAGRTRSNVEKTTDDAIKSYEFFEASVSLKLESAVKLLLSPDEARTCT